MKKMVLLVLLSFGAQQSFAATLNCKSTKASPAQGVTVAVTTDAFSSEDYSGASTVKIDGLSDSFMNVETSKAVYIKLENNNGNPVVVVPLENEGDGRVLLVFQDAKGKKATIQYVNVEDDYTALAEVSCR